MTRNAPRRAPRSVTCFKSHPTSRRCRIRGDLSFPATKIVVLAESAVLPTGVAELIRLTLGALIQDRNRRYDIHQVGLFHSFAVTEPPWPIYPTRGRAQHGGPVCFEWADINGEITSREL